MAAWAQWYSNPTQPELTLGAEEELMLLRPQDSALAQVLDDVLPVLPANLRNHVSGETHRSALELATGVHTHVAGVRGELGDLRAQLHGSLRGLGLTAAVAGTHPFTQWHETRISDGERYQELLGSLRELARREPTFALHVHVGVRSPERAVRLLNRMRAHIPLLLALSANSPFWQGRDTGLCSSRIPLFSAFPRVGIPRRFASYADYVQTIDQLIRCGAFPEPTFIWWDLRLQPRFGTLEIRVMDAQSSTWETAALVALIQCLARMELASEEAGEPELLFSDELLEENRFLATRDGASARLLDPARERPVAVQALLREVLMRCRPHARVLRCAAELELTSQLAGHPGAARQRALAGPEPDLRRMIRLLSERFAPAPPHPPRRVRDWSVRALTRAGG